MTHARHRVLVTLTTAVLLASCTGNDTQPGASDVPRASTTASATSASPTASWSITELAEQPCQALTDKDTAAFEAFDVWEEDIDGDPSCEWAVPGWVVSFTAYPTVDHTADPQNQDLHATVVSERKALVGYRLHGPSCVMYVAGGPGQSLRLLVDLYSNATTGKHPCDVAIDVATAIVSHLE
jgi:hypothetical protein